ncbi:hypothetical protein F2Q69_00058370 [Brassica cretica]|uniref:Uncharacterized protein n=1 Tax=Brassica cretica TaxID=69181 RepID=A0A8S9RE87_BRACR|nr:hypothetical protein F2Q69_00058370 [Brassica cretica]
MACVVAFHGGSLWFAVLRCRSGRLWPSPRQCSKRSSSGSFTFRLVFRFPMNLSRRVQVTALRFSKAAIGGDNEICGLSSRVLSFTGVSFRHSSTSQRHGQPLGCLWWCCFANNLFCRSQSFTGSGAAVVSDPLCVVLFSVGGLWPLSLSLVLAVKIRCTVWFYGALSLVSVFGLPIFITSRVLEALVCSLPLLLSVNELQVSGENKLNEIVMNQLLRQCHEK